MIFRQGRHFEATFLALGVQYSSRIARVRAVNSFAIEEY